jgi:hypothetical protein
VKERETNICESAALSVLMQQVPRSPKQSLRRLRRQIERIPPYPALLILAGPLAVVEPLKLATVFIAGEGHWIRGGLLMLFAYAVSLFVAHWLFVVVEPKLLTLPCFARVWARFVAVRESVALRREPRQHAGLMAHRSVRNQVKYFSAVMSSTQCSGKFFSTGDWGRFNENGRALPRLGRRMHQMGGRGVYGRSARVLSGTRANLARYRFSD